MPVFFTFFKTRGLYSRRAAYTPHSYFTLLYLAELLMHH